MCTGDDETLAALREAVPQIRSLLEDAREEQRLPGLSAAVICDQTVLLADGFGQADRETGTPAAADTVYAAGSVTKVFTATMLVQLRDAGKLDLGDPIARHLPGSEVPSPFPGAKPPTFRQAASHTTGLQRDPVVHMAGGALPSTEQLLLAGLARAETVRPAMSGIKYSNLAVGWMAMALARAAGQPYADYVAEHILAPLGMADSFVGPPGDRAARVATGYTASGPEGSLEPAPPLPHAPALAGVGSLYSTARDLARFAMLQSRDGPAGGEQVLCGTSLREMRAPVFLEPDWQSGFGIGWELSRLADHVLVSHVGYRPGYVADVALVPDCKVGVVVLANGDGRVRRITESVLGVMLQAADRVTEQRHEARAAAIADRDTSAWAIYEATYAIQGGPSVQVLIEHGELVAADPVFGRSTLSEDGEHRFRGNGGTIMNEEIVEFILGDEGQVESLLVGHGSLLFAKVASPSV